METISPVNFTGISVLDIYTDPERSSEKVPVSTTIAGRDVTLQSTDESARFKVTLSILFNEGESPQGSYSLTFLKDPEQATREGSLSGLRFSPTDNSIKLNADGFHAQTTWSLR